jgi:antitoxin VapB
MQILDERARELAEALALLRKVSVTEAVVRALEAAWTREAEKQSLAERLKKVAADLGSRGRPGGRRDEQGRRRGH